VANGFIHFFTQNFIIMVYFYFFYFSLVCNEEYYSLHCPTLWRQSQKQFVHLCLHNAGALVDQNLSTSWLRCKRKTSPTRKERYHKIFFIFSKIFFLYFQKVTLEQIFFSVFCCLKQFLFFSACFSILK